MYRLNLERCGNLSSDQFRRWHGVKVWFFGSSPQFSVICWMNWGTWVTDGKDYFCAYWHELEKENGNEEATLPTTPGGLPSGELCEV